MVMSPTERARIQQLWESYSASHDAQLRGWLIEAYLPLVRKVAARVIINLPSQVEMDELVSEGILGLVQAVDRFDPTMGFQFETFAIPRIQGAMIDGLRAADWAPARVRKRERQIEQGLEHLAQRGCSDPSDDELAAELNVSAAQVRAWMSEVGRTAILSLDDMAAGRGETQAKPLRDPNGLAPSPLADPAESAVWRDLVSHLAVAIERLPDRERLVVTLRYYEGFSASDVADILGVTVSRVSQLHTQAVIRLRAFLGEDDG